MPCATLRYCRVASPDWVFRKDLTWSTDTQLRDMLAFHCPWPAGLYTIKDDDRVWLVYRKPGTGSVVTWDQPFFLPLDEQDMKAAQMELIMEAEQR